MGTTRKQDTDFLNNVISDALLESSIEWIMNNMSPEEVFTEEQLGEWATRNGFEEVN